MAAPQLAHAKLIPLDNGEPVMSDAIEVQFNPNSLKVNLSNNLRAAEENSNTTAQYIESSSSSLAIELLFDSTEDNRDVREKTIKIAEAFMKPGDDSQAPRSCRFQWGSFSFDGMLQGFDETLDYFAPEGIPLRSTLSLSFSENTYQFQINDEVKAARRALPTFTPNNGTTAVQSGDSQSQKDWRATAMFNGIESPRFPGISPGAGADSGGAENVTVAVPSASTKASLKQQSKSGLGFANGASASLGSTIPGAFKS